MSNVLVLIADPARAPLPGNLERIASRAGAHFRWLADDEAFEIQLNDEATLDAAMSEALDGMPHDRLVLPSVNRLKRLLVSDMDSTMITVECLDELADLVGVKDEVAAITRRAMNGELPFEQALAERVALLAGLDEAVLEDLWQSRIRLMPGAMTLVRTMRTRGARTVLVSGGFLPIVEKVARRLGFERAEANTLEVRNGRLTGRVLQPVHGASHKLDVLREECGALGLMSEAALAIGDGANDLPMLEAAGLGVAFRPHPNVRARARYVIDVGDLSAVLYLQGLKRQEFARAQP